MSKRTFITIVFLQLTFSAWPARGGEFDVSPGLSADNDVLEARLLLGDPNAGSVGPWLEWNERARNHIWGVGVAATLDISDSARGILDGLLSPPSAWWELLDALGGRMYLVGKVGVVDMVDQPTAYGAPGLGIALAPFFFEQSYQLIETGGALSLRSGYSWQFGIRKIIRF
jgi:hypothetical protein